MLVIKRNKQRDQSPTQPLSSSRKLFADYPYPILTELEKACEQKQQKHSKHSYIPISLLRYKDYLNKTFDTLNGFHNRNLLVSTLEKSVTQSNINRYLSKDHANNLQQKTKPIDNKQLFASSITPIINLDKGQHNQQHAEKQNMTNFYHEINHDKC
ncbi:unnamed protein product [Rotaria sp. Silwood2]|nr:unnamed protein product [Rotaria sp. Silwood2]CAF2606543.1 unnamed protein product [Rotaria sp. Silwood2]CAF3020727.1 unnamed protein product [Rotaria sp. Silwood2]CAF3943258.1 unnamed protein product [Rotaria sp. Silwood2]CAF4157946.1 unnamed protein product [Rotaria sp. Silwood2]